MVLFCDSGCPFICQSVMRHVPKHEPIDLLNVAFENPRKLKHANGIPSTPRRRARLPVHLEPISPVDYLVPDRVGGLEEVEELRRLCPNRIWNFVEMNVDFTTSNAAKAKLLKLIEPCNTNMDLSLALALYFASEGKGLVRRNPEDPSENYHSTARILLNGLGSDELLGGYGRHKSAYLKGGWNSLADELQLDLDRISSRNLGRDDRVVASHGKEIRHPFLAAEVLNYVLMVPLDYKMNSSLPFGIGDKLLLRICAHKLGLLLASGRKKRAMQFGSHSARMDSGETEKKGHCIVST